MIEGRIAATFKSYKLSVPHVDLSKQRLTTSKIIQVGLYRGLNHS